MYKNAFFVYQSYFSCDGYHDGTQNFMIEKYGVLAFKWRVVSVFSTPRSKIFGNHFVCYENRGGAKQQVMNLMKKKTRMKQCIESFDPLPDTSWSASAKDVSMFLNLFFGRSHLHHTPK